MKFIVFIYALFCILSASYAQTYRATYLQVLNYYNEEYQRTTDTALLLFDNNESIYTFGNRSSNGANVQEKRQDDAHASLAMNYVDKIGVIFYKRKEPPLMKSRELLFNKAVEVSDTPNVIQWKLIKGLKRNINGYKCQKAEGKFGGRQWAVWYTPSIPEPNGPWKLGGLPGLIIEAEDSAHYAYFRLINIKSSTDAIIFPQNKDPKMTKKEYADAMKQKMKNLAKFMENETDISNSHLKVTTSSKIEALEQDLYDK